MSRAAIWDMDGTLVDTGEMHHLAWVQMSRLLGYEFTKADFTATFGKRNPEILEQIFPGRFSPAEMETIGIQKEELYRKASHGGIAPLPGVLDLLEGLHRAGFKQAIGSSAPRVNLDFILERTGIGRYFEAISAAEDSARGKPDPQVFLFAAAKLGVAPANCVVFEDAVAGIQAAKAAGMKAVAITFVGHHSAASLLAAGADRLVQSLAEISVDDVIGMLRDLTP